MNNATDQINQPTRQPRVSGPFLKKDKTGPITRSLLKSIFVYANKVKVLVPFKSAQLYGQSSISA